MEERCPALIPYGIVTKREEWIIIKREMLVFLHKYRIILNTRLTTSDAFDSIRGFRQCPEIDISTFALLPNDKGRIVYFYSRIFLEF